MMIMTTMMIMMEEVYIKEHYENEDKAFLTLWDHVKWSSIIIMDILCYLKEERSLHGEII